MRNQPQIAAIFQSRQRQQALLQGGQRGQVADDLGRQVGCPTGRGVRLAVGTWMQTVPDLVSKLQHIVTDRAEQDADDPIEHLPADFVIGIFSLRESSAQRVKAVLEARNQALDIRICTETVLNDQAKSLAQKADLVVVVWTCVSHALTYGIEPFLKHKPVFPQSSGSTSMIHAIEERVRTLLNESL